MTPIVVYVAGYGRSGSTLLDVLLGSQPGHLGTGELGRTLPLLGDASVLCSCGLAATRCPVWTTVARDLEDAGLDPHAEQAPFADVWRLVFDSLQKAAGANVVVDSSKSARDMRDRPLALARAGIDVRVVHIVRDPVSIVAARKSGAGDPGRDRGERAVGGTRSVTGWLLANQAAQRAARVIGGPSALVRYEDVVTDPLGTLDRLEADLALDLGGAKAKVAASEPLDPGHALWGNRMRWEHPLLIERRESKAGSGAGGGGGLTKRVAAAMGRRYGYGRSS